MKYFGILFLVVFLCVNHTEEEPLPQWLKVYQQVESVQSQNSTETLDIVATESALDSSEGNTQPITNSILIEFPSTLRLRDHIRREFKSGNYVTVVPYLTEILRREPNHNEMLYMMAFSLRKNKLWKESLVFYDTLLARKPDFKEALYERALVLQKLKRFTESLVDFNKTLELNPSASWIYYDRGILLKQMKKYQEAIGSFMKGLELRPNHSWSYLELGNIFFRRGQYVHAMNYYRKTLDLNPKAPGVEQNLKICVKRLEGR